MDFTLDAEQKALRDAVREMAGRLVPTETSGETPVGPRPHDAKAWSAIAEMGLLGLPLSDSDGGMGASPVEVVLAAAELGAARLVTPYADALAAAAVLAHGGEQATAKEWLPQIIDGSALVLPAFGEPDRTFDPFHPGLTATTTGDSVTVTGVAVASVELDSAAAVLVTAASDGQTGVYLVQDPTVDGNRATLSGASAVRVGGVEALQAGLNLGIVALAGEALGAMDAALKLTVDYLKTRKQFGVPLASFQTLTQRAADMYVSVELARSTALFAGMALTDDPQDTATAARTKVLMGRTGRHVGQEAIQLHGGIGMTAEYAVGHYTTRLTAIEHTFGDTRAHLGQLSGQLSAYEQIDVLT